MHSLAVRPVQLKVDSEAAPLSINSINSSRDGGNRHQQPQQHLAGVRRKVYDAPHGAATLLLLLPCCCHPAAATLLLPPCCCCCHLSTSTLLLPDLTGNTMSGRPDGYGLRLWSFTRDSDMLQVMGIQLHSMVTNKLTAAHLFDLRQRRFRASVQAVQTVCSALLLTSPCLYCPSSFFSRFPHVLSAHAMQPDASGWLGSKAEGGTTSSTTTSTTTTSPSRECSMRVLTVPHVATTIINGALPSGFEEGHNPRFWVLEFIVKVSHSSGRQTGRQTDTKGPPCGSLGVRGVEATGGTHTGLITAWGRSQDVACCSNITKVH